MSTPGKVLVVLVTLVSLVWIVMVSSAAQFEQQSGPRSSPI